MDDAIQVKGQKAARDHKKDKEKQILEVDSQSNGAADQKIWVRTDVVLLEKGVTSRARPWVRPRGGAGGLGLDGAVGIEPVVSCRYGT